MSTRGANFLEVRIGKEHLPDTATDDDPAAIYDLADQAMEAPDRDGVAAREMYEEAGSVFAAIAAAMQHREACWIQISWPAGCPEKQTPPRCEATIWLGVSAAIGKSCSTKPIL
ncbi:DUF768 domain-containing protein [Mesorhizobium sp. B4-1-3]|nr:DUF768 domain-containing protein [Mesorhizobium sp. B4-1-3]